MGLSIALADAMIDDSAFFGAYVQTFGVTSSDPNYNIQHGAAVFFVSNDHRGIIGIDNSDIGDNIGGTWYPWRSTCPGISGHSDTKIYVDGARIYPD